MAVRVKVVRRFSEGTGWSPAFYERVTGNLGNSGLTPKGRPGGGIGSAHYPLASLASVLMASSCHVPSEASDAVNSLEGLQALPPNALASLLSEEKVSPVEPGTTLRDYLEQEIQRWASPTEKMLASFAADQPLYSSWQLELSPSTPSAQLTVFRDGIGWLSAFFRPSPWLLSSVPAGAHRKVELTLRVLKIAGELLADTLAHQASLSIPNSAPGSADEGDATPDTTKASGTGIHEGLQSEQPAPKAQTAPLNKAQSATKEGSKQRLPDLVALRSRVRSFNRINHDQSYWTDAASP